MMKKMKMVKRYKRKKNQQVIIITTTKIKRKHYPRMMELRIRIKKELNKIVNLMMNLTLMIISMMILVKDTMGKRANPDKNNHKIKNKVSSLKNRWNS